MKILFQKSNPTTKTCHGGDKYNRQTIMHSILSFMTSGNRDDKEQCGECLTKDSLHYLLYI